MLLRKTNDHGEKWIADEHTSSLVGQMKSELLEFEKSPEKEYQVLRSMAVFLHNQDDEKEWYYSKEYWEEYFEKARVKQMEYLESYFFTTDVLLGANVPIPHQGGPISFIAPPA